MKTTPCRCTIAIDSRGPLYFRFQLSLRKIEELLFERGVIVSYETVRRWCDKSGAGFSHRVKAACRKPGTTWHLDEVSVTLRGEPIYFGGQSISMVPNLISCCRSGATRMRRNDSSNGYWRLVLRCRARLSLTSCAAIRGAKAEIPELANVKHVFVKASARVNNRAENSHQPARERERRMRGFRDPERTQAFLSNFGPIRQHFALKRHLLRASLHRKQLGDRFAARHRFTELSQNPSGL
jgi:putative transposase